ncbi:opine metallophore biosynthesis dehydrogenase [Paenibacillus solani]|uniref:opine metallophore biosynthesis dehydrogenase n=1 Tax=Paenibacillus solani TaxID=1705565 RepID=UPI003D267207
MNKLHETPPLGNVLIVGAGPAGIHVAVDLSKGWCRRLGLTNRLGIHAERLQQELDQYSFQLCTEVLVERGKHLSATARLDKFYAGFDSIEDDCKPSFYVFPATVTLRSFMN